MKRKFFLVGAMGLSVGAISACHDHNNVSAPPVSTSQSLSTAQVLALAQKTSETSAPLVVNGGAVTINDTSESAPPIPVSAM